MSQQAGTKEAKAGQDEGGALVKRYTHMYRLRLIQSRLAGRVLASLGSAGGQGAPEGKGRPSHTFLALSGEEVSRRLQYKKTWREFFK